MSLVRMYVSIPDQDEPISPGVARKVLCDVMRVSGLDEKRTAALEVLSNQGDDQVTIHLQVMSGSPSIVILDRQGRQLYAFAGD